MKGDTVEKKTHEEEVLADLEEVKQEGDAQAQTTQPSYDEVMDMLKRSQANLENYRKQTEKRIDEIRSFAKSDVIMKFIPVLDSLDLAQRGISEDASKQVKEGIEMIQSQLKATLQDLAVEEINTSGSFDPSMHEALAKLPSDKAEGEILAVFQRGYKLNGKVLRAARVQVSAGNGNQEERTTNENV